MDVTHPLREKARSLRRRGLSYNEIKNRLGINKSTLSYMLKDVELNAKSKARIAARIASNAEKIGEWSAANRGRTVVLDDKTKNMRQRIMRDVNAKHGSRARDAAGLAYRKDEIAVRTVLEQLFGRLRKEKIGSYFLDFANRSVVIEHSLDGTKGVQDLTKRFEALAAIGDRRRRIAYVLTKSIGKTRRSRLAKLAVEIRDAADLGT